MEVAVAPGEAEPAAYGEEGVQLRFEAGDARQPAAGGAGLQQDHGVARLAEEHRFHLPAHPDADERARGRVEVEAGAAEGLIVPLAGAGLDAEHPHAPVAEEGIGREVELECLPPARIEVRRIVRQNERGRIVGGKQTFFGV